MNDDEYIKLAKQKANNINLWLAKNGWSTKEPRELPDHIAANFKYGYESFADKIYDLLDHLYE